MRGLETAMGLSNNSTVVRLARRNYGTPTINPFIHGKHEEQDAYVDSLTGRKMAKNQIAWFIRKGDELSDSRHITRAFTRTFRKYSGPWRDSMVVCDLDEPPSRISPSVSLLCVIEADLSSIKKSSYEQKWVHWRRVYTAR